MAESAKKQAFALFDQGKRPKDPEVKALRIKPKSTYSYFQEWKKKRPEQNDTTTVESKGATTVRSGTPTAPITVGRITITPENWGMTQYGAILVLDTYNKAKRDINYGGTIGDFICDIFVLYRRIQNYSEEVEHVRESAGEGGGGGKEDGGESLGPVPGLIEGR